jgi:hypothetical protein
MGKQLETTSPGFAQGTFAPIWSYGEVLALVGSPAYGDPGSTQVLTQHYGAKS